MFIMAKFITVAVTAMEYIIGQTAISGMENTAMVIVKAMVLCSKPIEGSFMENG